VELILTREPEVSYSLVVLWTHRKREMEREKEREKERERERTSERK